MKKCAVSKKCGACRFLDVPYNEQLKQKRTAVRSLFPGVNVEPVIGMEDPYHYRHKVYCAFGLDRDGHVRAGLFAEKSHRIIYTTSCLIQHTGANAVISDLCHYADTLKIEPYDEDNRSGQLRYAYIRVSHKTGKMLLTLVIGSKFLKNEKALISLINQEHPEVETIVLNFNHGNDSMVLSPYEKVIYGKGRIIDTIKDVSFSISSRSFYQVNPVQTEKLYETAISLARLNRKDNVLDVCCGIGTISLLAAKSCNTVLGVEINPQAVSDARYNASLNKIRNAHFEAMDAQEFMLRLGETPDVVFLDPPRSGMSRISLSTLGTLQPERIVYISCNPETQARDTKFLRKYGYYIKTIVPVDQFPFTPHVETVCLMSRKEK